MLISTSTQAAHTSSAHHRIHGTLSHQVPHPSVPPHPHDLASSHLDLPHHPRIAYHPGMVLNTATTQHDPNARMIIVAVPYIFLSCSLPLTSNHCSFLVLSWPCFPAVLSIVWTVTHLDISQIMYFFSRIQSAAFSVLAAVSGRRMA